MPNHQILSGCYIAQAASQPWPQNALPLWNDTIDSDQAMAHLMDKAADPNVDPEVVATFSCIPNTQARIEKRHLGEYWAITQA
jgi:hypothetical protein